MAQAFLHGLVLSLALILPLGPQNTFVLTQGTRSQKLREAAPVILTAAFSDTFLIMLAVAGVSLLVLAVPWLHTLMGLFGVLYILYMGTESWITSSRHSIETPGLAQMSRGRKIWYSLSVSLLNPHALIDTVGVIGAASVAYPHWHQKLAFGLGAVLVSWVWFFLLAIVGHAMGRVDQGGRVGFWIQRVSALLMWMIGLRLAFQLAGPWLLRSR